MVRSVYALYRMLANTYMNIHKDAAFRYEQSEVVHVISGLIASGGLAALAPPVLDGGVAAPLVCTRADLRRPRVKLTQSQEEDKNIRRASRIIATKKQTSMDLKSMKRMPKKRISSKRASSALAVKPVRPRRVKKIRNSGAIASAVEEQIASQTF